MADTYRFEDFGEMAHYEQKTKRRATVRSLLLRVGIRHRKICEVLGRVEIDLVFGSLKTAVFGARVILAYANGCLNKSLSPIRGKFKGMRNHHNGGLKQRDYPQLSSEGR